MDGLTSNVREMYMNYPFPKEQYNMTYGAKILKYFYDLRQNNKKSFLEGADILDAGCGTGSVSLRLAKLFPDARITAFDLTDNSLLIARRNAEKEGIKNVEFVQGNLLNFNLSKKYDAIFNIGVLHHLSDPQKGLINIKEHLKPSGRLVLWLYGKYGRFRLNLNQKMFGVLLNSVISLPEKVRLVKNMLKYGPQELLQCHFNVADSQMEDKWEKSRDWILTKDEWIVDQFLHYNERVVNIENILELLENANLRLDKWIGVQMDLHKLINDDEINSHFKMLNEKEKLVVLDLLYKPNYYTITAQLNK